MIVFSIVIAYWLSNTTDVIFFSVFCALKLAVAATERRAHCEIYLHTTYHVEDSIQLLRFLFALLDAFATWVLPPPLTGTNMSSWPRPPASMRTTWHQYNHVGFEPLFAFSQSKEFSKLLELYGYFQATKLPWPLKSACYMMGCFGTLSPEIVLDRQNTYEAGKTASCRIKAFSSIISLEMVSVMCQKSNQLHQLFGFSSSLSAVLETS